MAELRPYPFGALVTRMFRELDERRSIFDLPQRKFYRGDPDRDLSIRFQGHHPSTPLGPAAGPHTQMAQNIVLSFLGGCRVMELKTVQFLDELELPRPCIDMETIGFNVEWSQELRLEQSVREYVAASMLIEMLIASGKLELAPGYDRVVYDMSVGYDLAGIKTPKVQAFIGDMRDATRWVDALRAEIPDAYAEYRDLDFRTELSDTLTLSTFHGCPPSEIEQIMSFLLDDLALNAIVKLNPTLLGPEACRGLLNDTLGYEDCHVPDAAFTNDATWAQATDFVGRLGELAEARGRGFGVKFTNTLIVENHRDFFPATEKEMYLSGPPLHVLAMNLVGRFRGVFGDRHRISFSAGIDKHNFAESTAIGLTPVTTCSDLLKAGGYGRAPAYLKGLSKRMEAVGASSVDELIIRAFGHGERALRDLELDEAIRARCEAAYADGGDLRVAAGDAFEAWVSAATLRNTESYVERCTDDPRYAKAANSKPPKKIGSQLTLFECITCDKCVPVCPNDANFPFELPRGEIPVERLRWTGSDWEAEDTGALAITKKHQLATWADFCNECGNCDVFCPEDGGPYVVKPRFFGTEEDWRVLSGGDGFYLAPDRILGRFGGRDFEARFAGERASFCGADFAIELDRGGRRDSIVATRVAPGEVVDLTYFHIMCALHATVGAQLNYVTLRW